MSDDPSEGEGADDPEIQKLIEILQKDEDDRSDEDWDALGDADPPKLKAAGEVAGVSTE